MNSPRPLKSFNSTGEECTTDDLGELVDNHLQNEGLMFVVDEIGVKYLVSAKIHFVEV